MKPIMGIGTLMVLAAWSAPAQDAASAEQKMKQELEHALVSAKVLNVEGSVMGAAVKGAPYTATEMTESTQVLADGTRIHNEHQTTVYRDGMGRIRRESGDEIAIMDPVANVRYALHPSEHTAIKLPMAVTTQGINGSQNRLYVMAGGRPVPAPDVVMQVPDGVYRVGGGVTTPAGAMPGQAAVAGPVAGAALGPDAVITQTFVNDGVTIGYKTLVRGGKVEDLGTQSMEGVVAQGTRTTRTIETGAIGNDRPINMVSERWFSPDLQTVVMTKQTDPREGETDFKLTNIQRGEPDPSLFQVPAGYQVTEAPSPFFTTTRHE